MQKNNRLQLIILNAFRQTWPLLLLTLVVFGAGAFCGTIGVNTLSGEDVNRLTGIIENFTLEFPGSNVQSWEVACSNLKDNIILWGVIYLLGLTIIGIPMILVLVFMRGFSLGFTVSFLTGQNAGTGTFMALVSIIPHNLAFIPSLIISGIASLSFTIILLKRFFNSSIRVWPGFLGYTAVMTVSGLFISLAALIETFISPWIIKAVSLILNGSWSLPV